MKNLDNLTHLTNLTSDDNLYDTERKHLFKMCHKRVSYANENGINPIWEIESSLYDDDVFEGFEVTNPLTFALNVQKLVNYSAKEMSIKDDDIEDYMSFQDELKDVREIKKKMKKKL